MLSSLLKISSVSIIARHSYQLQYKKAKRFRTYAETFLTIPQHRSQTSVQQIKNTFKCHQLVTYDPLALRKDLALHPATDDLRAVAGGGNLRWTELGASVHFQDRAGAEAGKRRIQNTFYLYYAT